MLCRNSFAAHQRASVTGISHEGAHIPAVADRGSLFEPHVSKRRAWDGATAQGEAPAGDAEAPEAGVEMLPFLPSDSDADDDVVVDSSGQQNVFDERSPRSDEANRARCNHIHALGKEAATQVRDSLALARAARDALRNLLGSIDDAFSRRGPMGRSKDRFHHHFFLAESTTGGSES